MNSLSLFWHFRRILPLLLAAGLVFAGAFSAQRYGDDVILLDVELTSGDPGDIIDVAINVTFPVGFEFSAFELEVTGFQTSLDFIDINLEGSLPDEAGWSLQFNDLADQLLIAAAGADNLSGSGILLTLQLSIPETAPPGFVDVILSQAVFDNGEFPVEIVEGGVNIGCLNLDCAGVCDGEAFIDSCGECVGGTTGLEENWAMDCSSVCFGSAYFDDCQFCDDNPLNDNLTCTGCTDPEAMNYDPGAIFDDASCEYVLIGDLNQDGNVNVVDIILMVGIILQDIEMTDYHLLAGDIVPNGSLDIVDIVMLVDLIMNMD